nr:hypothetical protein GCM10020241_11580 [Streptoalloteichus tenebrarius]
MPGEFVTRKRLSREESREQTRERLLTAAAELFAERGVNGTSVEQIAERAGYTRGAFYGNFEDKHHLVLELLHRRTRRELDEVRALGEGAPSPAEALAPLRAWHRDRARHLDGWLALRMELLLYALRNKEIRPLLATREHFARDAHADGIRQGLRRTRRRPARRPRLPRTGRARAGGRAAHPAAPVPRRRHRRGRRRRLRTPHAVLDGARHARKPT